MTIIDSPDEVIDSRDLIETMEYLAERGAAQLHDDGPLDDAERDLLAELRQLADQNAPADWLYGETFIRDDHFEEYARQLADDIGAVDSKAGWPACHIDWEAAADALKQDYYEVRLFDRDYWTRG